MLSSHVARALGKSNAVISGSIHLANTVHLLNVGMWGQTARPHVVGDAHARLAGQLPDAETRLRCKKSRVLRDASQEDLTQVGGIRSAK